MSVVLPVPGGGAGQTIAKLDNLSELNICQMIVFTRAIFRES